MKFLFDSGNLFVSTSKSYALTINPWKRHDRTITYADHTKIIEGEILLLVEYAKLQDCAIYIWLYNDGIVWQILNENDFKKCWKHIENDEF